MSISANEVASLFKCCLIDNVCSGDCPYRDHDECEEELKTDVLYYLQTIVKDEPQNQNKSRLLYLKEQPKEEPKKEIVEETVEAADKDEEDDDKADIYVTGMRVEKRIGVKAGEDNCTNDTYPCNSDKYILFCYYSPYPTNPSYHEKFTITLWQDEGWCGSGYCQATFGHMKIDDVDDFGTATHKTKTGLPIKIKNAYYDNTIDWSEIKKGIVFKRDSERPYEDAIKNNVFAFSEDGGDEYYPGGYIWVNMDLFEEYKRAFEKRPVWIFYGDSATGKSTLAYYLRENKVVYETDSSQILPAEIWADIVVVGTKYEFSIPDILARLPEGTEPITVHFDKSNFIGEK